MTRNADEQVRPSAGKIIAIVVGTILAVVLGYVAWFIYQMAQVSNSLAELSGSTKTAEERRQADQADAISGMLEVCPWLDGDESEALEGLEDLTGLEGLDDFVALIRVMDADLGGGNKKRAVNFDGVGVEMRDSFGEVAGEQAHVTAYRCLCGEAPGVAQAYLGGGEGWWRNPPVDPGPNAVEYVFRASYNNEESTAFFGGNESRIEQFERAVGGEGMHQTGRYEDSANPEAGGYTLRFGSDEGLLKKQSFPLGVRGLAHQVDGGRSISLSVVGKTIEVIVRSGCLPADGETFEQAQRENDERLRKLELEPIPAQSGLRTQVRGS